MLVSRMELITISCMLNVKSNPTPTSLLDESVFSFSAKRIDRSVPWSILTHCEWFYSFYLYRQIEQNILQLLSNGGYTTYTLPLFTVYHIGGGVSHIVEAHMGHSGQIIAALFFLSFPSAQVYKNCL